ncbi:MAG: serine/threonine protein kinase [Aphanothece sp. CMT-3BRIN-NPC111]|nr:serine/threonine protein kinase [Aphanothece sp. CMT-3BRIN-NPC111]
MSVASAACCINPDCPRPSVQPWGNKFCNSCGASLELKNRYIPLQRLGSGGFATIYTIWDLQAKTERVLKVLVETSPKALELFEQEAAVLASLRHPGVPRVEPDSYFHLKLVLPQERMLPCLVMEKIDGQTLQDILCQYPQGCPEASVLNWLKQALEILGELHRRQIIHRDIKPSNLMLRKDSGHLVTIDFGGAKQIGLVRRGKEVSSTRLVSPGYSPPEQIAGSAVGPPADFYALGRTMIHLLTGKYPADLEDPVTGDLRWRNYAQVSPALADVLDEMVLADAYKRPATAAQIQALLAGISTMKTTPSWAATKAPLSLYEAIAKFVGSGLKLLLFAIAQLTKALAKTTLFILRAIASFVRACLDTVWEMLLGGIGAIFGTTAGFLLAYLTLFAGFIAQQLPPRVSGELSAVGPQIVLFALAGLGTAVGLTEAGGFGQRRRSLVAGLISALGYGLAWLIFLQAATDLDQVQRFMALITIAVTFLTLGLGLPSHHLVHSLVATGGTATVFAALVNFFPIHDVLVNFLSISTTGSLPDLGSSLAFFSFFSLLGVTIAFWLGVSYYVVVPFLRWLGWR